MADDWGETWRMEAEEAAERHAMTYGESGIPQAQAARIAESILADPHTAPPSNGVKPGPRRNRHLDGFGGRNNA